MYRRRHHCWSLTGTRKVSGATASHTAEVDACDWSPDDARLITCGGRSDKFVRIWDTASGALLHAVCAHDAALSGVSWGLNGTVFLTASVDQVSYELSRGPCLDFITSLLTEKQRIKIWDSSTLLLVHVWEGVRATAIATTATGLVVAICHEHKVGGMSFRSMHPCLHFLTCSSTHLTSQRAVFVSRRCLAVSHLTAGREPVADVPVRLPERDRGPCGTVEWGLPLACS
jgi:WD40 repeat protein